VLAGVFLAITGGLLIWDLEHPRRFYYIFTRPQWKSWLVRGAFIIAAYGLVLALHVGAGLAGRPGWQRVLAVPGVPLAAMAAAYTAYLFAQARARDLWQNPLLPPHFLIQAVLSGAAVLVPFAAAWQPDVVSSLLGLVGGTSLIHLLVVGGESTLTHTTAHAHLAAWEMIRGRYRPFFWGSVVLSALGTLAPWTGPGAAAAAITGLLVYEHAYVQSGQSVPLA
jgi:formate-dependent nitrite reductase membrane component NrfD